MKKFKKALAIALCLVTVLTLFAGCSSKKGSDEITESTMLIAYTEEKAPFIYTNEKGELDGFDVKIFDAIFEDIKQDYKNYKFVKVDEGYRLGEDPAYINDAGEQFVSYIMIGGLEKNVGTNNEDYTMTTDVISNKVITITDDASPVKDYKSFAGARVGVVGEFSQAALDENAVIKNVCKPSAYNDIKKALADLDAGKIDAVVTDEFTFCPLENAKDYKVLDGKLDEQTFVYGFKKWDWFDEAVNEAIFKLKDEAYYDGDGLTPLAEGYFGYDATCFDFTPSETK